MIKSWIFELFNTSSPQFPCQKQDSYHDQLQNRLNSWIAAESLGYHGIFFSEHHFTSELATPSPILLAAALAMRTDRIKIGLLGIVLPLSQPWRVAEDISVLDHLSKGRLEVGFVRGSRPQEASLVGIENVQIKYDEALEIVTGLLNECPYSYQGTHWNLNTLELVPRPFQNPSLPVWSTALSEDSAIAAAQRGSKLCTGFLPLTEVKKIFDSYRETLNLGERPDMLGIRHAVFIGSSEQEAVEHSEAGLSQMKQMVRHDMVYGTPSQVAEQIIEQARFLRFSNFIGFFSGDCVDYNYTKRNYQLFGEKVIPILKKYHN